MVKFINDLFYYYEWSTVKGLLATDETVSVHQRNIRILAIEMCKIPKTISHPLMRDMVIKICIPLNTRLTTKVEEDESSRFTRIKKSNWKVVSKKFDSIRYWSQKIQEAVWFSMK